MVATGIAHLDAPPARFWHRLADGRIQCDLCPRSCKLSEGQRGVCFAREVRNGELILPTYGRSSGFCVDPIEKKPLFHFLPGSSALSFGTAGCNLNCAYCQNWDISKAREMNALGEAAAPEEIADAAQRLGCRSVAFTYNDPVVFHEYAIEVAKACRARGLKTIAVTAGYQNPEARAEFYRYMDAANVDLKAFSDRFYEQICGGQLAPVLETIEYLHRETKIWIELTTLVIPGENDSDTGLEEECSWIVEHLGLDVPIHFTAFHPEWRMRNKPRTPYTTLSRARRIARRHGIHFVYTGNVHDIEGASTYCPACNLLLAERNWYELERWNLTDDGHCKRCGTRCPGVFEGPAGRAGTRSEPVTIHPAHATSHEN